MIKKFKNFDAKEFINKKKALKEAVESLESKKQAMEGVEPMPEYDKWKDEE